MKMPFDSNNVSDELLNAFVDSELDKEEHLQLLQAQLKYPSIHNRICELRQIKELVSSARHQQPSDNDFEQRAYAKVRKTRVKKTQARKTGIIAASVLLLITIGIISFAIPLSWLTPNNAYSYAHTEIKSVVNKTNPRDKINIVFHVNKNNVRALETLFTDIENLLVDPGAHNKNIRIEVLTSGPGLPLLDTLSVKHLKLINRLYTQHENISFVVCQQTLKIFRDKTKKLDQLPRGMVLTASAPELIKLRRSQGWTYISI